MASRTVVVIGGGPAGLATSYELKRRGIDHIVLERGEVADSFRNRVYDSLTLHTGKHMSSLPGMPFGRSAPLFIGRDLFVDYLRRYRETFALPVERAEVRSVSRDGEEWLIETDERSVRARHLVVATGIMSNPIMPSLAGSDEFAGTIRHSSSYRRPDECRGKRVLVIGCGNSAGEIASELGGAGVDTTVAIRSGNNIVPLQFLGIPIQYLAYGLLKLPRFTRAPLLEGLRRLIELQRGPAVIPRGSTSPLEAIPMIGFRLDDAIRNGSVRLRHKVERLTPAGARFSDGTEEPFDEIIMATGFRAAVGFLPVAIDERGFAQRSDRVRSREYPHLYFVGHTYDAAGALFNIRRDARLAAEAIAASL